MSFYVKHFRPILVVAFLASVASGCTTMHQASNQITVQGKAIVMGNMPFAALILQTDGNNSYILKMEGAMRDSLMTPAYINVSGTLYLDEWNGLPFAHIRVDSFRFVDEP